MGFSRQEDWSGLPCPPPRDRLDAGIKLGARRPPALAGGRLPLVPPKCKRASHESVGEEFLLSTLLN